MKTQNFKKLQNCNFFLIFIDMDWREGRRQLWFILALRYYMAATSAEEVALPGKLSFGEEAVSGLWSAAALVQAYVKRQQHTNAILMGT
jgi:hypothetical protein